MRRLRWAILLAGTSTAGCTATQVEYEATLAPPPLSPSPEATLFLVGDAGEANEERSAVLAHLRSEVDAASASGVPVVVAYLGDNIYEVGARPSALEEDLPKLEAQVEPIPARSNVRGVFVPGNHDWAKGGAAAIGRAAVQTQREWLGRIAEGRNVALLPGDGCPGPSTVELGTAAHLVFIDTEWLLREPPGECGGAESFYERLEADLQRFPDRPIVAMGHHPMVTGGPHGGNVAPLYRGPFVFYLATKAGVSRQDLVSSSYAAMITRLDSAFLRSGNPPLVFAAGHDHNLQVIRSEALAATYQLVSGSGSKSSNARRIDGTRYATNGHGYMRLDFLPSEVRLVVVGTTEGASFLRPIFSCVLSSSATDQSCPEARLRGGGP